MSGSQHITHTACEECDLLIDVPEIQEGERALCPRCGHTLTQRPRQGFERALAFAIAGCVFFVIALAYPFLTLSSGGIENVMTLPEASIAIYREQDPILAVIVFVCIIALPIALLATVIALVTPLVLQRRAQWLPRLGKLMFKLNEWAMVEVFVIGTIVSLVKIAKLAKVELGLSFLAYILFAVCLTAAISGLDRMQVWKEIEAASA
ncbi:MAG: paraquat-inducible protein A [Chromatiales bacterium]|nr:MAG: paraquat-inducible protein A [Chromatiales bacterium]